MTTALLDTHTLLWWLSDDERLSAVARETVADPHRTMLVSVAIKQALGELDAPDDLPRIVVDEGFEVLAITAAHAWAIRSLPRDHGDPSIVSWWRRAPSRA